MLRPCSAAAAGLIMMFLLSACTDNSLFWNTVDGHLTAVEQEETIATCKLEGLKNSALSINTEDRMNWAAIEYGGKIFLMGGTEFYPDYEDTYLETAYDVLVTSQDGFTWVEESHSFLPAVTDDDGDKLEDANAFIVEKFIDKLWIVGGIDGYDESSGTGSQEYGSGEWYDIIQLASYSTDGTTWPVDQVEQIDSSIKAMRTTFQSVVCGDTWWLFGQSEGWSSTDGINWTGSMDFPPGVGAGEYSSLVVCKGSTFYCFERNATSDLPVSLITTDDGTNWTIYLEDGVGVNAFFIDDEVTYGFNGEQTANFIVEADYLTVYKNKFRCVADVGGTIIYAISEDGIDWQTKVIPTYWNNREGEAYLFYDDKLWIFGGEVNTYYPYWLAQKINTDPFFHCWISSLEKAPWNNPELYTGCGSYSLTFDKEQMMAYYEEYKDSGAEEELMLLNDVWYFEDIELVNE